MTNTNYSGAYFTSEPYELADDQLDRIIAKTRPKDPPKQPLKELARSIRTACMSVTLNKLATEMPTARARTAMLRSVQSAASKLLDLVDERGEALRSKAGKLNVVWHDLAQANEIITYAECHQRFLDGQLEEARWTGMEGLNRLVLIEQLKALSSAAEYAAGVPRTDGQLLSGITAKTLFLGSSLPLAFETFFDARFGNGERDGVPTGPGNRFVVATLEELGYPETASAVRGARKKVLKKRG